MDIGSCLETQAALCEAQGHPELALPCLLQASALLRRPEAHAATAARYFYYFLHLAYAYRHCNVEGTQRTVVSHTILILARG